MVITDEQAQLEAEKVRAKKPIFTPLSSKK
jgi:hypothetical protein